MRDSSVIAAGAGNAGAAGAGGPGVVVPKLRGLLHAGVFPVAVAAGAVLVALAPGWPARVAAVVYGVASAVLFGVSAAYHRSPPGSRRRGWLGRLDHMNILLLIAGTYTPLMVLALRGWTRVSVLAVVWAGAAGGIAAQLAWRPARRWVSTSLFIGLGWVALFVLPQLLRGAGVLVLALVLAGGVMYSLGGVVYARKRPDPSPRWFGFHEVFHAATIAAYFSQYAAVSLLVYR
jgi:hemolysin III